MVMTEPRIEQKVMRVKVRCGNYVRGRTCDHVIAVIRENEWEQQRALGTTVECKRCGNVERLARFM